jgi:hypothetical protein
MLELRLAEGEEELAAACVLAASRVPAAAAELAELERLHIDAAAALRLAARQVTRAPAWPRVWSRLRAAVWKSPTDALEWLRDRELALARRYMALRPEEARAAWHRYMLVEHLLALWEFGELASV